MYYYTLLALAIVAAIRYRNNATVRIFAGTGEFMSARTFADVDVGKGLWYENSNKLVELAVNQGSAAATFRLQVGEAVSVR